MLSLAGDKKPVFSRFLGHFCRKNFYRASKLLI